MNPESEARKQRSIALLRAQGVPYYEGLAPIESAQEAGIRDGEAVVRRAMCLFLVAMAGMTRNRPGALKMLQRWELTDELTPKERGFLKKEPLTDRNRAQFSWQFEAVAPLMWSTGLLETLPYPDQVVQVDRLSDIWRPARAGFWRGFQTRGADEILDEADLTFRRHWAVRSAMLKDELIPAALDPGVVQERRHALDWLIGSRGEDWDDVSCGT